MDFLIVPPGRLSGRRDDKADNIRGVADEVVELRERKAGEFHLQRLGVEPLSPEAIVDGSTAPSMATRTH